MCFPGHLYRTKSHGTDNEFAGVFVHRPGGMVGRREGHRER